MRMLMKRKRTLNIYSRLRRGIKFINPLVRKSTARDLLHHPSFESFCPIHLIYINNISRLIIYLYIYSQQIKFLLIGYMII